MRSAVGSTLSQVLQFKVSSSSLPSNIVSSKKKAETPPAAAGPPDPNKKQRLNNPQATMAVNPNINAAWKIPTGKEYQPLITNKDMVPKSKSKDGTLMPFCINFHTTGKCKNGTTCTLLHDDPRKVVPSMEAEYTAFMAKCYT